MDVFNFCWMTLLDESKKSCVFFDKDTCNVRNDIDENFNKPLNRISYLYKFGSYNISLFHQCFQDFCAKVPDSLKIIDNFLSLKNLTICSLSAGPGTDIIGFLYSLYRINKPLVNATVFKVISRYGSWRNLVNEMINSSIINVPDESTCKLIECDFLKDLNKKAQEYLKLTDILLICNSFSSSVTPEKVICDRLKSVTQLLKPGALVFFIFNKEKSTYFKELLSFGSFLYEPVEVTLENIPYNEKIVELVGVKPLCSGTSLFAVWQKCHEIKHEINFQKETENSLVVGSNEHSLTKLNESKSVIEDIISPTLNLSNLKKEFSSDSNISSSDVVKISSSLASSSQFSSISISSQVINRRENSVSDNSVIFTPQNIDFSEINLNNSARNTSPAPLGASNSSVKKKSALPCGSAQKKIGNDGKNLDSLLKNFDNLITKFEGLISSEDSLKHYNVKEKQSLNSQYCHQNMYEGHCRCSVKSCQFNENGSICCHSSVYYNYTSDSNHNCSTSTAHTFFRTLPQEGPCIVIPLQNLSDESLTHILSIVSQNTSVNKTLSNLFPKEEKS